MKREDIIAWSVVAFAVFMYLVLPFVGARGEETRDGRFASNLEITVFGKSPRHPDEHPVRHFWLPYTSPSTCDTAKEFTELQAIMHAEQLRLKAKHLHVNVTQATAECVLTDTDI